MKIRSKIVKIILHIGKDQNFNLADIFIKSEKEGIKDGGLIKKTIDELCEYGLTTRLRDGTFLNLV